MQGYAAAENEDDRPEHVRLWAGETKLSMGNKQGIKVCALEQLNNDIIIFNHVILQDGIVILGIFLTLFKHLTVL